MGQTVPADLVIEILSKSTARRDRTAKKEIYAANGVREYWLVDPKRRQVTVFVLHDGVYGDASPLAAGVLPSEVLPGLDVTVAGIFRAADFNRDERR